MLEQDQNQGVLRAVRSPNEGQFPQMVDYLTLESDDSLKEIHFDIA